MKTLIRSAAGFVSSLRYRLRTLTHLRFGIAATVLLLFVGLLSIPIAVAADRQIISPTTAPADGTPGPDLTGHLLTKDGKPLTGTVFISTAAPKVGVGVLCPSCYFDCTKNSKTGPAGEFKIESLDPSLTFQVLAVAKGYKPKSVSKIDPAKGPIEIQLDPIESSEASPDRTLRGRVVDPEGKPIEGAIVNFEGIATRDGGGRWGNIPGIDPLAVTDENGEFMITSREPFDFMTVKVEARMFANRTFQRLPSGLVTNVLTMTEGASISGRVLHQDRGLSNIVVGISGKERSVDEYAGHFEVATGPGGHFLFVNVPPETEYVLYGTMNSLRDVGSIPVQTVRSGKDSEKTDVGNLVPVAGHRLAGKVILADGVPLPDNTRLLVSREEAWDSLQITLGKDGSFDVSNLPSETVSLGIRVKDYRISRQNRSLDPFNSRLVGIINRDITDFVLLLEKGAPPEPNYNSSFQYEQPHTKPLRGAEGGVDHSNEWLVMGQVSDSSTKEPIAAFRVTPGAHGHFNLEWDSSRVEEETNGSFSIYVPRSFDDPHLLIEADGYLPTGIAVPQRETTNLLVTLQKGSGPAGVVVSSDGTPEHGATVVMVRQTHNQANLNSKGELTTFRNPSALQKTGTDGKFSFKPQFGIHAIAASSSNGFAFVRLENLGRDGIIKLQPFGKITGELSRDASPATNEVLDVSLPELWACGIMISTPATTDSQGRFEFNRVPPGKVQISARQMNGPGRIRSWTQIPLKQIQVNPGETVYEKLAAIDKPASPEPFRMSIPELRRVEGEDLKGVVLSPDGKPVADVQVALHVKNHYLSIGKGKLNGEDDLFTHTKPDGTFTLPLYEGTLGIVAANPEGIATMNLDEFKASSRLMLQKWGSIEGSLTLNEQAATNEFLSGNSISIDPSKVQIDSTAFSARTDDQGRFVLSMLPPGRYVISRRVPRAENRWTAQMISSATVESGKVTPVALVLNGRKVSGRILLSDTNSAVDFQNAHASLQTPSREILSKLRQLKTDEEKEAFQKQHKSLFENLKVSWLTVAPDGSFEADQVQPGKYELNLMIIPAFNPSAASHVTIVPTILISKEPIEIMAGKTSAGTLNLGNITVEKIELPIP